MPYIKKDRRPFIFNVILVPDNCESVGELNYAITEICKTWLEKHGTTYTSINDVIGVLECAKLEFYRRIAVPYEDIKIKENGDVY